VKNLEMTLEWVLKLFENFWFDDIIQILVSGEQEILDLPRKEKEKLNYKPNLHIQYCKIDCRDQYDKNGNLLSNTLIISYL
jgi:hypothetical protein